MNKNKKWEDLRVDMRIRLLATGGTIEKEYNKVSGLFHFPRFAIPLMLEEGSCRLDIATEPLIRKDSLDFSEKDYQTILDRCRDCEERTVLISHGTDKIVKTARILGKNMSDKTVILFGAMKPHTLKESDALFNLGGAIIAVQTLPKGVYIVMQGRIFAWDNVQKNPETGDFEPLKRQKIYKSCF